MFCYKCGEKLNEGAKFCHVCGVKVNILDEQMVDLEEEDDFDEESGIGTEAYAIDRFYDTYQGLNIYGKQVYMLGQDDVPEKIQDNSSNYFNYDMEMPFIIFNYGNNLAQGFVITSSNIIWKYNYGSGNQCCKCSLYDIKEVRLEKAGLAKVMRIITNEGKICKEIYLTGMDNIPAFANKFSEFVRILQDKTIEINDDFNNDTAIREEQIANICNSVKFDNMYCEVGNPLQSKKEKNARKNFDIPLSEKMYLVCDTTVFGGCRKGLAICSSGFYFYEGKKGYIAWKNFKNIPVSVGLGGLHLGDMIFNTANDGKRICQILNTIQSFL